MVSKYFVALFFCNLWAIVSVLAIARMHTMCSFKVKTFVGWWLSSPSFRYSSPTLIMLHVASISSTFPSESSHFTSDFYLYFYHTPPDRLIFPLIFASISITHLQIVSFYLFFLPLFPSHFPQNRPILPLKLTLFLSHLSPNRLILPLTETLELPKFV